MMISIYVIYLIFTLQSTITLKDSQLKILSKGPGGETGTRIFDFTDTGLTMVNKSFLFLVRPPLWFLFLSLVESMKYLIIPKILLPLDSFPFSIKVYKCLILHHLDKSIKCSIRFVWIYLLRKILPIYS